MAYSADKKPGELTALTSLATDDIFVVGDTSDASEVAKGITKANLITDLGASFEAKRGADDNYVTDAEKIVIGNTSGTNTGDQDLSALAPKASPTFTGTVTLPTGLTGVLRADSGVVSTDTDVTDLVSAASDTAAGKVELSTDAEAVTGTDTARAITPANLTAKMSAPGAIGNTTASTGKFSSVETTGDINLGHATDTTLSRVSAGVVAVEGVTVPTISSTNTLTNKRVTKRTGTTTSSATPTINTDNVDFYSITAQTEAITSMTTNLSGTPTEGQTLWIAITGTAARAITWGASFEASTVALPTTTVTTNRLDVGFVWNTVTSKWRCIASS